jgi:hypothetical protein
MLKFNFYPLSGDGSSITKMIEAVGYSNSIFPIIGNPYPNILGYQENIITFIRNDYTINLITLDFYCLFNVEYSIWLI